MLGGKKFCVVLPAYDAAKTLEKTLNEIPSDLVDDLILVDDASKDDTAEKAYTQTSGGSKYCDALGGLADQDLVASRGGAGADPEQGIEGGLPRAAPVEAEHELIEVVLKVSFPQSVVDAQAPTLEI